jgi:hypothetical protein
MAIRILLGEIGAEWKRILLELARQGSDMEIVGIAEDAVDLLLRVAELKVNVVVLAQLPGGGEPGVCSHLMLECPNVAILLLPMTYGCGVLWRMVLRKESWSEISGEGLLAALKVALTMSVDSSEPANSN